LNVRVKTKPDLAEMPRVASAVREVERRLGDSGRVLVRYSGTEPLLRVMLEGPDQRLIQEWAELIADSVRQHIG